MDNLVFRRQILKYLRDSYPSVSTTADVAESAPMVEGALAVVQRELAAALARGYVENLNHIDEPWWRITAAGMDQINRETAELDRWVWGRNAL